MEESSAIFEVKRYWDNRPCNIRHSKAQVGSKVYFDEVEDRKYFVEPHIRKFAKFENWSNKQVLEIGCGIGTDAVQFSRFGAEYTGTELSLESMLLAQKRFEVYGLKGNFIEANVEEISHFFPNKYFDLIYSFGVLHHTPNILRAFQEIRKLCHSETIFKFMVYSKNSWKFAMIEAGLDQPEAQFGCPIANTYSEDEIRILLTKSNFELVDIEVDHIFPYKVDKYVNYIYEKEDWFESMPSNVFEVLQKKFGWHLLVSAKPNKN